MTVKKHLMFKSEEVTGNEGRNCNVKFNVKHLWLHVFNAVLYQLFS